jgi:alpha-N-arabinofuranosidase
MKNKLVVHTAEAKQRINKNIYGHFAEHLGRCVYDGIWVDEDSSVPNTRGIRNDIVEALKAIQAPVIRWPGGCFADEYHWKDAIGPRASRKKITNTHWGGTVENNRFGTHEFFDFCSLVGAEPYICGNVGSGTVQEMQEWIEYMNAPGGSEMAELRKKNGREKPFGIHYFGIGNENWGCGGRMRAEYYADVYKRYQTYVRKYEDYPIFKIACGPRNDDYHWTEVLMREAGTFMNGLALHYYTRLFSCGENKTERRGSALDFDEEDWYKILKNAFFTEHLIKIHSAIMDRYDPEKRVALIVDEWGTWFDVEPGTNPDFLYQQNSIRDALVAGISLNIFNNHCDRVQMANIAQTINVLQAMALTEGDKIVLTPTYHVFDLYKVHQDAVLLPSFMEYEESDFAGESIPGISRSASMDSEGKIHISLCNVDPRQSSEIRCEIQGKSVSRVSGRILAAKTMKHHNSFDDPASLVPADFGDFLVSGGELLIKIPPMSVLVCEIR